MKILGIILALILLLLPTGCGEITFDWPAPILEEFDSYAELRAWLDTIEPELLAARQETWDCQDFSWWLFYRALDDGYIVSFYVLEPLNYEGIFGRPMPTAHALNATYINGYTYFIEPQGLTGDEDFIAVFPDFEIEEVK